MLGEAPPTAGLPPRFGDLWAGDAAHGFEAMVAARVGTPGAILTPSGASALLIALDAIRPKWPLRRTVIIPAYTCPLVVIAIAAAGLSAVACDLKAGSFDLDPNHLGRLIDNETLAVIPTHYGGWVADIATVRHVVVASNQPVTVIEDAAQAYGAMRDGRSVGADGDIGFFSFAVGKGLTLFEGGALVSHSPALLHELRTAAGRRLRRDSGLELTRATQLFFYHVLYNRLGLRLVFGMGKRRALRRGDEIAAALDNFPDVIALNEVGPWRQRVGLAAAKRLDTHLEDCRARASELGSLISRVKGFTVHRQKTARACDIQLFVTCQDRRLAETVTSDLWPSRLGVGKLFARVIGDYPELVGKLAPSATPNARDLVSRMFTVTTSPLVGADESAQIANRLGLIASRRA